jgi:hypothetical protein
MQHSHVAELIIEDEEAQINRSPQVLEEQGSSTRSPHSPTLLNDIVDFQEILQSLHQLQLENFLLLRREENNKPQDINGVLRRRWTDSRWSSTLGVGRFKRPRGVSAQLWPIQNERGE